jgi:spermidine synthase
VKVRRPVALVAGLSALVALHAAAWADSSAEAARNLGEAVVVYETASRLGRVFVVDQGRLRFLRFGRPDATDQTVVDRENDRLIPMPYLRAAVFAALLAPSPRDALLVGLGGGAFARALLRQFPVVHVDAVEIDPAVVRIARIYFGVVEGERLRVHVADAADFFVRLDETRARGAWDVILLDAYDGPDIPTHLATAAFFERVSRRLSASGAALANVTASSHAAEDAIVRRFAHAFRDCIALHTPEDDNVVLVGAHRPLPDRARLVRLATSSRSGDLPFAAEPIARTARPCVEKRTGEEPVPETERKEQP